MIVLTNTVRTIATEAVADGATILITSTPSPEAIAGQLGAYSYSGASPPGSLVVCDAASLDAANAGNAVLTIPVSVMHLGMSIALAATSAGLTISELPAGVALHVDLPD